MKSDIKIGETEGVIISKPLNVFKIKPLRERKMRVFYEKLHTPKGNTKEKSFKIASFPTEYKVVKKLSDKGVVFYLRIEDYAIYFDILNQEIEYLMDVVKYNIKLVLPQE